MCSAPMTLGSISAWVWANRCFYVWHGHLEWPVIRTQGQVPRGKCLDSVTQGGARRVFLRRDRVFQIEDNGICATGMCFG